MSTVALQIGMTGLYVLAAPFNGLLKAGVAYTCVSIRKFEDLIADGVDPKVTYYLGNGLSQADYDRDYRAGLSILTLQSSDGSVLHVPQYYVVSAPDQGGIPYRVLALGIKLSATPDSMDLSYVKSRIQEVVRDNIGVESEVQELVISSVLHLSQTEHAALEAARQAKITSSMTDYAQLLEVTRQRDAGLRKIQELEAYIRSTLP